MHEKNIRLVHCSTTEMIADVLTKPLGSYEIKRFHGAMSGFAPIPHPPFAGEYGHIGMALHKPDVMQMLSDVQSTVQTYWVASFKRRSSYEFSGGVTE